MIQEINAIFDGKSLQLESPLNLDIGTRVKIIVETILPQEQPQKHFLKPLNLYSYKVIQIGLKKLISIYMGKLFLIMNEVFLDTSFAIALSSITDQHHAIAVQLADQLQATQARLVTNY
jgi:Predicted nucleic acid-binding protein, contains PIN domain